MASLTTFTKQPTEVLDYTFDFSDWFEDQTDTPSFAEVTAEDGLTVVSSNLDTNNLTVSAVVGGGEDGGKYKVTCRVTTEPRGLVKEADILIRVKEV